MSEYFCLPFSTHPLRDNLYDELHARPFQIISTPQQISHLALKAQPAELNEAFRLLCELCRRYSVNQPGPETVSFEQNFGEFTVRWERHMEFYSLTFLRPAGCGAEPFRHPVIEMIPQDWTAQLPGQAVAAFHIVVDDGELPMDHDALTRYFEGQRLIMSQPKEGKALLCTAFKLHSDGFGRFLIQNRGISDYQMGRLVQRIVELETYRLLAQLSLPLAKRISPELNAMDQQLAEMLAQIPHIETGEGNRDLLFRLSTLSARLESYRAETNTRFSATRAYHELVLTRLQNIQEEAVNGHMTVAEFMTRRLTPGLRTCQSVQGWMEDLSKRIERAGDMMRTRVNLTLQEQNKSLLAAMNRRGRLQFRLQETVEGLSVAAISYYLVGLLSYVLNGVPLEALHLDKKVVLATLVPFMLGSVWWLTQRIKHRLIKEPLGEE
ncbi:hypothetical protein DESUT3_12530 [Desulfuromonas versatilis]|uniref:DUF3422 domain-containing protein n=1 Tax=Desulfuromonas versatilis TaxID=2802975 RepID=A0ABN6DWF3_9BACT|nr:DUF3422 domain-containing protein [Desulfuromonas versatilis]BCR04184.1 hypothetical protein DESUT3_12530 [Desulfuromonas versatilis]